MLFLCFFIRKILKYFKEVSCMKSIVYSCLLSLCITNMYAYKKDLNEKSCDPRCADYVIVGVGTAGATMAKLLSDNQQNSVIALHNGANLTKDPLLKFAAAAPLVVVSALFDAPYYEEGVTIPQSHADNRELLWVLSVPEGGASQINASAYARGTNFIYSQWQAIAGKNWSVDRILDIYKKLERYVGNTPNQAARGYHGPLTVRQPQNPTAVSQKFTQAIIAATGLPFVEDYNDPETPTGASTQLQYTQSAPDGTFRVSSATAFLNKQVMTPKGFGVDGRKLRVLFNSTALRIVWKGRTAIGVEYMQNGKTKRVFANKKVIVCAGLFSSAFLMHSGIGPKKLLRSLNIPVIFDNPNVGQYFTDQDLIPIFFTTNPDDTPIPAVDPSNYLNNIAWLPDPLRNPTVRAAHLVTLNPIPGIAVGLFGLSPAQSRGSIVINSADPLQPPVIDSGILSNPVDLHTYQNLFMITLKNINTALQAIDPGYQLIYPDPAILNDSVAVTDFIRDNVMSNQCFQSHCRMAPLNQGGVVDSFGNVYGVRGLAVADDSIVPEGVDGTPMASAYLIAANIADLIQQQ
jgi:choline dehydrogenase-like flavoprotein